MMACMAAPTSSEVEDEFEKLVIRMNPPRVTVDNTSDMAATLVTVDSANKFGSLLEVVQVLTDLSLTIRRAYISSDGEWFMDVFHVVDQDGNKLYDSQVIERIEKSLVARSLESPSPSYDDSEMTTIELIGRDRPGLLSEVSAVLTDLKCDILAAHVWTHDSRMAALVHVADTSTGEAVGNPERLDTIKRLLRYVLKRGARTAISAGGVVHRERRLHQIMHADRSRRGEDAGAGEEEEEGACGRNKPVVVVEDCAERGYTHVVVRCKDRPKLLFDTVCTLTDLRFVVFHGTVIAEGREAHQEYYIRHHDGRRARRSSDDGEKEWLRRSLEAAIERRSGEGVRMELKCEDRTGLLADVTRSFREHGLSVTQAEVSTSAGGQARDVFYVVEASGQQQTVDGRTIEAVRKEIGERVLTVKEESWARTMDQEEGDNDGSEGGRRFSLRSMIRSGSEKVLYNLGLIRSYS